MLLSRIDSLAEALRGRVRLAACPESADRERGSAVLEFVVLGLLLLVPMVYIIITAAQLQGGSFAVVGAADQAAKVYVEAEAPGEGQARARQAAAVAVADFGFDPATLEMSISCSEVCLTPGSFVTVSISVPVPLPLVPSFGGNSSMGVVHSTSTQIVERFG